MKWQPTEWDNKFANHKYDEINLKNIHEVKQLISKKINDLILKCEKPE
jgi:hypothetical protein